jgi:hypothetical protein
MAEVRLYSWTDDPAPADDVRIPVDRSDFAEARSVTKTALLADEVADRTAADNDIIDGAGLNADGSLSPDPTSSYLKNADFLAAGYDVNLRNAARLLDTAIADVASNNELTVQIDLSSAEILASGTPIIKLIAPGAGQFYHMMECDAINEFNSAAYNSAGAAGLDVQFTGASDQIVNLPITFLEAAATQQKKFLINEHELYTNTTVEVVAPDGNPTNGDGTISIRFRYLISAELAYGGAKPPSTCCVQPLADSFTAADVTALGNLEIYHGFNSVNVLVVIFDNTMAQVATTWSNGDEGGADDYNYVTVPVGLGIPGTWRYMLLIY